MEAQIKVETWEDSENFHTSTFRKKQTAFVTVHGNIELVEKLLALIKSELQKSTNVEIG